MDQLLSNPLAATELSEFLVRTAILLGAGLAVMTLTQLTNLRRMVGSLAFKKFCSWIVIVPCLLLIIFSGRGPFLALILFLQWHATKEYLRLLRTPPFYRKVFVLNQVITFGVMVIEPELVVYLPACYVLTTFVAAGARDRMFEVVRQVAFTIVGCIWIGYFLALLVLLYCGDNGKTLATVIFGVVIVSDVFAFLLGSLARKIGVGTAPLARNISPNKVVAGVVGNVLGALLSFLMFGMGLGLAWWFIAVAVVLAGVGAAYGDLAESMLKRAAGIKDSSNLIPFHGGMLDRIDSLLFVVPIFYLLFELTEKIAAI